MVSYKFKSNNKRSELVKKNIMGTMGLKAFNVAVSFVLVPLTIDYVSNQMYGVWLALASVLTWMSLFDVGFGHGLRNRIAENNALGNYEKCQQYISTSYFCMTAIFLPLSLIASYLCTCVDWEALLNVSAGNNEEIAETMMIVVFFSCATFVAKLLSVVLTGIQHIAYGSVIETIGHFVILLCILILRQFTKGSLILLAIVMTVVPLIVYLIATVVVFWKKYSMFRPKFSSIRFELVKDILNLGVKFFIIQIACLVLYGTINVIISNATSPEYVTEYNVVYKYLSVPYMVFGIVIAPFWSAFTDAYTLKDYAWMNSMYDKLFKTVLLSILVVVALCAFYPIFFHLWLGDSVNIHLSMVLVVAFYVITGIWNSLHSYIINGTGYISLQLYISLISTALNIPVAIMLGHMMGAEGVVLAVCMFNILPAIILFIQVKKILRKECKGIWAR